MNISIVENTIRFEDENGSHAWPLYMDAPISHPIIAALTIQETPVPVRFDDSTCTIQAGSDKITPETDLSDYPEEVRTFAQVIYSYDNNKYSDLYYAKQVEETPPEPTEEERIEIKRNLVLGELVTAFQSKFYSNIQAKDKSGDPVTIQFRDDKDRANLETVVNASDILSRMNPSAVVTFKGQDNVVHQFLATDFVALGMQVQQEKQAILYTYGDKKEEVRALTTLDELNSYPGWI